MPLRCTLGGIGLERQKVLVSSSRNPPSALAALHQDVAQVREELDDHRAAINENTSEIQGAATSLCQLGNRIAIIEEQLAAVLKKLGLHEAPRWQITPLSEKEKQVFLALYLLTETAPSATYMQLSRRSGLAKSLVVSYVASILEKGVPLQKQYVGKTMYLSIEPAFRQEQARENLVGLSVPLTYWLRRAGTSRQA